MRGYLVDKRLVPPFRRREKKESEIKPDLWPTIIASRWREVGRDVSVWKLPTFGTVDVRANLVAGLPRDLYDKLTAHLVDRTKEVDGVKGDAGDGR
jgi:hypothetical protein